MDFMILDGIQKLHSPLLDTLFVCITRLGDKGFVWCLMALVFLLIPEKRKTGFICVAAILLTEITGNHILKPLFARVRPCDVNQAVQLLIANPGGYSFPSGHTSASFAAASVLRFREKRKVAVPALLLAALIGFSRMYLYVHYPTDIAGGILLGTLMGYVCVQAADRIKYRKNSINIERK